MIITVDGPAGSGKSTVAKLAAKRLGIKYLDTGATYRLAALIGKQKKLMDNIDELVKEVKTSDINFEFVENEFKVYLNGEDVTEAIRTEEISEYASKLATEERIREVLVDKQREIGKEFGSFITEGRDQGTVVFPNADLKIYLEADVRERAKRRYKELIERGDKVEFDDVLQKLIERDKRDKSREISPLRIPEDGIVIDSTNMSIDEVVEKILKLVREKR